MDKRLISVSNRLILLTDNKKLYYPACKGYIIWQHLIGLWKILVILVHLPSRWFSGKMFWPLHLNKQEEIKLMPATKKYSQWLSRYIHRIYTHQLNLQVKTHEVFWPHQNNGQQKIGTQCCNTAGSEFGVKNMKAWLIPALYEWFRLMVAM